MVEVHQRPEAHWSLKGGKRRSAGVGDDVVGYGFSIYVEGFVELVCSGFVMICFVLCIWGLGGACEEAQ